VWAWVVEVILSEYKPKETEKHFSWFLPRIFWTLIQLSSRTSRGKAKRKRESVGK
jgi:hypothetical protein